MRWVWLVLALCGCGADLETDGPSVPTDPAPLHDFLASGGYLDWRAEDDLQPGLNRTMHRVFLNEAVDHHGSPMGAAAVRELWDEQGERQLAWSAVVKVDAGEGPAAWFFYETYDFDDRDGHLVAETNATGCAGCHAAGADVIRSTW